MKNTRAVRAEFRIRQTKRTEESVFVRAQSILDAHSVLCPRTQRLVMDETPLKPGERKALEKIVTHARNAAKLHPNEAVEVSPYVKSLLRMED